MIYSRRGFLCSLAATAASDLSLRQVFATTAVTATPEITSTPSTDALIRLNRNENPYGPSAKVAEAIRSSAASANRYAGTRTAVLREAIAASHQVGSERVVLGCGSTEILRAASCAYLGRGKQLLQASPTFAAIEHYARVMGADVTSIGLTPAFSHDLSGMLARATSATALVYVCNPNNPTASLTPHNDLDDFISKLPSSSIVVIDEAYHQFAGHSATYSSFLDHPLDDPKIVVTRTFSKVYGLAGLRLGYAVASRTVAETLRAFLTEDNINSIAAEAALAALEDVDTVNDVVQRNASARQEFFNQAMARALKPIDSHTNFVMMDTLHPGSEVGQQLRGGKILIGPSFPQMKTHIRVSLGSPEDMSAFWRVWDSLPYPKHTMHH